MLDENVNQVAYYNHCLCVSKWGIRGRECKFCTKLTSLPCIDFRHQQKLSSYFLG
jgi:hypothetical protein